MKYKILRTILKKKTKFEYAIEIGENCRKNYGIVFLKVDKVAFIPHHLILFYSFRLLVYSLVRLDLHKPVACCTKFRWNFKQTKVTMVFIMVNVNTL